MYKKFTVADIALMLSALASLIYAETLFFKGAENAAIFVGLWVPSILGFGIYLKLILNPKK